jgi:alkyl sulfatase BDS1-like metallo-beta-lactamase superfamily hydrolase
MAKADFEKGEYQWVAEITNVLVYADPTNEAARLLCADALEQLGYQAESGTWRNSYLGAARELREGNLAASVDQTENDGSIQKQMTAPMLFDYMAILLDKEALADKDFVMNVTLTDIQENYMLRVKNGVVLVYEDTLGEAPDVSITCPKNGLFLILQNQIDTVPEAIQVEGNAELLNLFMENLNQFSVSGIPDFNLVEP